MKGARGGWAWWLTPQKAHSVLDYSSPLVLLAASCGSEQTLSDPTPLRSPTFDFRL
jgi:hypothetical protein